MEHMMRVYRTSQHVTQGWWGRFCGKADYDVPTICVDVCVLGDKPDSYYEELTNYDQVLLQYLVKMFREDSFPMGIVDGAVSVLRQELSKESQAFIDEQPWRRIEQHCHTYRDDLDLRMALSRNVSVNALTIAGMNLVAARAFQKGQDSKKPAFDKLLFDARNRTPTAIWNTFSRHRRTDEMRALSALSVLLWGNLQYAVDGYDESFHQKLVTKELDGRRTLVDEVLPWTYSVMDLYNYYDMSNSWEDFQLPQKINNHPDMIRDPDLEDIIADEEDGVYR